MPAGVYHLFAGGIRRSPYGHLGGGTTVTLDGLNDVEGVVVRAFSIGRGEHWIAGHVSNAQGAPVAGAQIDVVSMQVPPDDFLLHTDETGAFLADGLAPGNYVILATAAGYIQARLTSPPLDGPDLAITLQRNVPIRGHVLDRDRNLPLAGAKVTIAQHDGRERDESLPALYSDRFDSIRDEIAGKGRATTGADGAFEISGVEPGRVLLKAERAGYAAAHTEKLSVEPDRPVEDVTIYMTRGATVEGVVSDTNGTPVAGASILVAESTLEGETQDQAELRLLRATNAGEGSRHIRALADDAGRFSVEGLAVGEYWMRAIAGGYAYSPVVEMSVRDEALQSGYELVLDPGGTVEGRVTQGGVPRPDVIVQATREGLDADALRVYSNAEGYYIIEHVMPGDHEIRAADMSQPGNAGLQIFNVDVVSGKTIRQDFEYSGHLVRGMVSGLATPAEWQVAILRIPEGVDPEAPPDLSIDWVSFVAGTAWIGADGSYAVENLADGIYKLEVFQLRDDDIVPNGVWKTIAVEGEDLTVDVRAADLPNE